MRQRFSSWILVLLAAVVAAAIYGILVFSRMGGDPPLSEVLQRLPAKNALTIHVDVAAIRKAGLGELLDGSQVAEEPDYRRFVSESGFDWKTDLEAVTASRVVTEAGTDWYLFIRGRFDLEKVRNFALSRGGTCKNGVCDVAGDTPGKRVSFYPLSSRVLVIATSKTPLAVYALYKKDKPEWVGGVPEGAAWVSFDGSVLSGEPTLPSGGRLFGKVLSETRRTTFGMGTGAGGMELQMFAYNADTAGAANVKAQLEGVTREFKKYFERVGQPSSDGDLSGLLLSGQFGLTGTTVTGRWPLPVAFLKKLAGGGL